MKMRVSMLPLWIAASVFLLSFGSDAVELSVYCTKEVCDKKELATAKALIERKGHVFEVVFLDQGREFEKFMSTEMEKLNPSSEEDGARMVSELLNSDKGRAALGSVNDSLDGLNNAVDWRLKKLPAFICENAAVTYGGNAFQALDDCIAFVSSKRVRF